VEIFRRAAQVLRQRSHLFETEGEAAAVRLECLDEATRALERELQESTPLGPNESLSLLTELRQRIVTLHERETKAAEHLRSAAS
jgi:hypothetical protein